MGVNKKFIFICILATLIFSVGVLAEPIIELELTVYSNDSIGEYRIHLTDGRSTSYHRIDGYNLTVLNDKGGTIFNQPVEIELYEPAESTSFYYKIPYDTSMHELQFYHGEKLIFSKILNFCNSNGFCDTSSETYETCPIDCPLDHNDIICIAEPDGACDPDCGEDVDPDCNGKFYPYAGQNREIEVGGSLKFKGEIKNASSAETYSYSWFFEYDGSTKTGRKVSHKFDEEGVYAVDLTVTNQDGVHKDDTLLVTVTKKKIVKETKPFFTRIPTLMLLAVALLGIVLFYKKLKEIRIKLRIGIITLISILLVSVILLSFFFIGEEVEYYHENYCEKDSDCEGWGCGGCRSIFKGLKSKVTSQAITGMNICLGPICVCENNQCEPYSTENVSKEYCERREEEGDESKKLKSYCYTDLAKKLNDIRFCDSVEDHDIKLQCKEGLMSKDITVEFCRSYTQEGWKIACIRGVAKRLNDTSICNKIEDEGSRESCIIYDLEAVTSREDCEKMKHYKSNCYSALSKKINDSSLCDKVTDEYWKGECILRYATSKEDCEKIEGVTYDFKNQCITEHVTSIEDCEKIKRWECYNNLAQKLKDPDICYRIQTDSLRENCISQVLALFPSLDDCEKIKSENTVLKATCYINIALIKKDVSICDKLEINKGYCYWKLAEELHDFNICKKTEGDEVNDCMLSIVTSVEDCEKAGTENEYYISHCYYKLATEILNNTSLCDKVGESLKSQCVAESTENLKDCERLEKDMQSYCYYKLAQKLNDFSLCDKTEQYKEQCVKDFKKES